MSFHESSFAIQFAIRETSQEGEIEDGWGSSSTVVNSRPTMVYWVVGGTLNGRERAIYANVV